MLIFESLSAGSIAVLVVLLTVLVLVGLYADVVWPLTKWELLIGDSIQYRVWWQGALCLIFAAGSAGGFWYFSGVAFRKKPARQAPGTPGKRPAAPSANSVPRIR